MQESCSLTVDTTLKNNHTDMKAYVSTLMGIPGKTVGTMFTPIKVEITSYEPERVGVETIKRGLNNPKRIINLVSELQHDGKVSADSTTGRYLLELVTGVPKIDPEAFEEMFNSNMKDLLMVVYLSNLTRTQLLISEKLTQFEGVRHN
ncbi:hypothetical protein NP493_499g01018 [Ridgeia piscesae]|uniref:EIF3F/CSN6-like C-terminal domain-containing protein n=1 Tax=Ridgeia piscesae TaxID=27915 RepID=A0AAD9KYN3_RIDPI|nr:hypothetical protein NP493_499g01018 [Ridgeia piscesae]